MGAEFKVRVSAIVLALFLSGCGGGSSPSATVPSPTSSEPAAAASPLQSPSSRIALGQDLAYVPAGSNAAFPRSTADLEADLARRDVPAMRRHAWGIWQSLTATTDSHVPVMLTWYQGAETFGPAAVASPRVLAPQFLVGPRDSLGHGNPPVSFNVYNDGYRRHVLAHDYQWRDTMTRLVGNASDVVDFPLDAIVVKTVWWPVRHDGLTAFPVWDDQPTRPTLWGTGIDRLVDQGDLGPLTPGEAAELKSHVQQGNEWGTFKRIVAIDPKGTDSGAVPLTFFDPADVTYGASATRTARVVPLDDFLHCRITDPAIVEKLNNGLMGQVAQRFWGRDITPDDYLALVAVHITTREAPAWVWTTYWWHDDPSAAPYGDDRPDVAAPFNHFRMDVAQSADIPTAPDGGAHIAYNPYLEGGFARGVQSNCIACHQRARWDAGHGGEVYPVRRGSIGPDDPFYNGTLRTHLLWSLVFRPRPRPDAPPSSPLPDVDNGVIVDP